MKNRVHHQPKTPKPKPIKPHHKIVLDLIDVLKRWAIQSDQQATGQATLQKEGHTPVVVAYAAYPNGDYLAWFNDDGKFTVYSLVNEKFIKIITADTLESMFEQIGSFKDSLGSHESE